jgi:signal transduction histidine kinase
VLLSLATTILVVTAFVVPLGLLVRRQAVESAKVGAERDAQSVASLVALVASGDDEPSRLRDAIGELPDGTIVVIGDAVFGAPKQGQGTLVEPAASSVTPLAQDVEGGWEIALPVVGALRVAVVDSYVSSSEMTAGVATALMLLAALAVTLIGVGVWVADRLGRVFTSPIEDLARSAHRLADGDLETRVDPSGPTEIEETGMAFNLLASRLGDFLTEERESVADLSHRIRTPLTSLRFQAEALADDVERSEMLAQVDRLERAMNQVIELTRSRADRPQGRTVLDEVTANRVEFWQVLADEQQREMSVTLGAPDAVIELSAEDVTVVIDILIGNVFSHTAPSTALAISTHLEDLDVPVLEISDEGPGFSDGTGLERGVSGAGSTGLGLDIVRKTARVVGGDLEIDDRPGGGAVVRVRLG